MILSALQCVNADKIILITQSEVSRKKLGDTKMDRKKPASFNEFAVAPECRPPNAGELTFPAVVGTVAR